MPEAHSGVTEESLRWACDRLGSSEEKNSEYDGGSVETPRLKSKQGRREETHHNVPALWGDNQRGDIHNGIRGEKSEGTAEIHRTIVFIY